METNKNEHITTPNLWNTANVDLRGKFTALEAYIKKQEESQINNLTLCLKELEEQQTKPNVSRRKKKKIKIRAQINKIGSKKHYKYQ